MNTILLLLLLSAFAPTTTTENQQIEKNSKINLFQPVIDKLISQGADSTFVYDIVKDSRTKFGEKYCKFNVTGFLGKADYSKHYNKRAVTKTKLFYTDNLDLLDRAEKKYNVPKEIISALLYVETRHGNYLGKHHVVSVYLSLAMVDQQYYVKQNIKRLDKKFKGDSNKYKRLKAKVLKRTETKSAWAIEQLLALEKVGKKYDDDILNIRGSWAGAFGISQFIPTSFVDWAVDGNNDNNTNLFDMEDAVFSVANYLKINGWGDTLKEQKKALYHYNHSDAYVNAILKLAKRIKS